MRVARSLLPILLALPYLAALTSCSKPGVETPDLQAQVENLQKEVGELQAALDHAYKPGFGEFMLGIQIHHAKLWFAGKEGNWDLARFEVDEIRELTEDTRTFQADRPEAAELVTLTPALDEMTAAIEQQDPDAFVTSYENLTDTCNGCHEEVDYPFNRVRPPTNPPFDNQVFAPLAQP